ncbi:uncharacterized protein, YigZ family [Tangfeifania diversioriginum]|uniref:Uncharacterized protein, YigZ family n=1 Tax=Tangfeifania diversioriginum TaxID=1168035 RepID=A0A1M6K550_9BACT|nr:YigZ family protein [Tangfeifania diversioriginum]SHJ53990.1 uncharacterized protein, YigZ family [Tangfeifania diversioriginum]
MEDTYKTIAAKSEGYFKDKGSKFIAYACPVSNEDEIKEILTEIKKEHHNARHHCYAWRLGTEEITWRANDDGEPSSTAGRPILGQLQSFDVTNVFIVVVRYFGGTLLGTSGLINAYKTAAADALSSARIVTKTIKVKFKLHFTYPHMNDVMQIIKQENLNIVDTQFEIECDLFFTVRKSEAGRIEKKFQNYYGAEIEQIG